MADSSYIESMFSGLKDDIKRALVSAFDYTLDNLRLGPFESGTRSRNFQWYWISATERATGGTITTSGGYQIHTFTTSGAFTTLPDTAKMMMVF